MKTDRQAHQQQRFLPPCIGLDTMIKYASNSIAIVVTEKWALPTFLIM